MYLTDANDENDYYLKIAKSNGFGFQLYGIEKGTIDLNIKYASSDFKLTEITLKSWYYLSIIISPTSTPRITVHSISSTIPLIMNPNSYAMNFNSEKVFLELSFKSASFKELKLYSYEKYSNAYFGNYVRTQVDPQNENLIFYYPLDGIESTRFLYNSIDPNRVKKIFVKNLIWTQIPDNIKLLCPMGYYYNPNFADITASSTFGFPQCIKQSYTKILNDELISINILSNKNYIGLYTRIYKYKYGQVLD